MSFRRPGFAVLATAACMGALVSFSVSTLRAEDLRTIVAGSVTLSAEAPEGGKLVMGYSDAIAVVIQKDSPFIQGFEIELKLPPAAISLPGGFAYELWRRVDPAPDKNRYAYKGERIITQPLPARAGFVIQIPVRKDHGLRSGPYATLLPVVVEPKDFPFLFKLIPVAKGIGSEIESAQFQVRIRPLLTEEGALNLRLHYPEASALGGKPVTVLIDDRKVDPASPLLLKFGPHKLRIESDAYRDETRSFTIEQGQILDLVVDLQDTTPLVQVEAPDSAIVSLDGQRLDLANRSLIAVEPGEHTLSCRIGDYSLMRKFTAFRGKTYKFVLSIELLLQELP